MRGRVPDASERVKLALLLGVFALLGASPVLGLGQVDAFAQDATPSPAATTPGATPAATESPAAVEEPRLGGTLQNQDGPVAGVTILVESQDGSFSEAAATGEDGSWEVQLPGPGQYQATVQTDTLPEGVELRDPERTTLGPFRVRPGQGRTVIFALGESTGGSVLFNRIAQTSANGLKFGLIIAMTAVGLSLVFGTTGLINFAHGELVTFGAIVAWFWNTGQAPAMHLVWAAVAAVVLTGAFGGALEIGLFRPLRKRKVGLFQLLIITIGLSLVIRHVLLIFFGGSPRPFATFTVSRVQQLGPITLSPRDLSIMGLCVVFLVAVATMLQKTKIGKAMRAVSDNRDLAESSGIDVQRVILVVWVVGAALAALGGIFYGSAISVDWLMGFRLLLLMFAGVILGGLGTAYGAMVGSIVVGLVTEVSTVWFPSELKFMWGLVVLILVLLVRPQGILGRKERIG